MSDGSTDMFITYTNACWRKKKAMEAVPPSSLKYIVINPTVCHTYGVTNFGEEDCGPGGN
ncbi:MAG: hypothetical protein J6R79_05410 [Bacteroidaceae bacterium]|nr:hypothetical protein [Bacteroidaceae bacterium]